MKEGCKFRSILDIVLLILKNVFKRDPFWVEGTLDYNLQNFFKQSLEILTQIFFVLLDDLDELLEEVDYVPSDFGFIRIEQLNRFL